MLSEREVIVFALDYLRHDIERAGLAPQAQKLAELRNEIAAAWQVGEAEGESRRQLEVYLNRVFDIALDAAPIPVVAPA
ncbi:MAG: hypothetical protein AAFO79_10360 [Pseudomonadota bacterium]